MQPTTALGLSHKHPDDYGQVAATLEEIRRTSGAFSTRHRIIDTHGEIHHVVVVGRQMRDDADTVIGSDGFYVDVTPSVTEAREERVTEAVAEIAESRGVIEQAKGMLMLVYRISADSRSNCSSGDRKRPTSNCGCWPSRPRRTSSNWPTTRFYPPGPNTTGCC